MSAFSFLCNLRSACSDRYHDNRDIELSTICFTFFFPITSVRSRLLGQVSGARGTVNGAGAQAQKREVTDLEEADITVSEATSGSNIITKLNRPKLQADPFQTHMNEALMQTSKSQDASDEREETVDKVTKQRKKEWR